MARPETGPYRLCPYVGAPHALPWGSAQYVGLGFLVFVTIIICERFGSPIMKSCAVVLGWSTLAPCPPAPGRTGSSCRTRGEILSNTFTGLLVGCIVAAACGYFDRSGIDAAPVGSFIWVHTFKLSLYGPLVLPLLAV